MAQNLKLSFIVIVNNKQIKLAIISIALILLENWNVESFSRHILSSIELTCLVKPVIGAGISGIDIIGLSLIDVL
jgi:hypothetical protein